LLPFVLGFSTSLVIQILSQLVDAVQAFLGRRPNAATSPPLPPKVETINNAGITNTLTAQREGIRLAEHPVPDASSRNAPSPSSSRPEYPQTDLKTYRGSLAMNARRLSWIVAFGAVFLTSRTAPSQTLSVDAFDRALKDCVVREKINLPQNTIESVSSLYAGENSRKVLSNSPEFLQLIPESQRIEAYRLYADCIEKIVPQIANTAPKLPTQTYRICVGEYERACQPHEVYLYCGINVEAWAKDRCTSPRIRQLNSYGGNKCGYSLVEVICIGPK
jgi:hypothetical protein